jgi:hypothetical protein
MGKVLNNNELLVSEHIRHFCTNEYNANLTCPKPKNVSNTAENYLNKNKSKYKKCNKKN